MRYRWTTCLFGILSLLLAGLPAGAHAQPQPQTTPMLYVYDQESSAWLGAQQGVDELNQVGRFTGLTFSVQRMGLEEFLQTSAPEGIALIAALTPGHLEQVSAKFADIPVLNVSATEDALRRLCRANLLHVIPSAAMQADAVAQWRQKHPEAEVEARAWHPAFVKYAGRDLNNRFRAAHGVEMDSMAWAGWAATRAVGDAVTRAGVREPGPLLEYLREKLQFDGQKGTALSFRPTGQLRQPLLIIGDEKIVGEAPVAGVVDEDDLDSLGLSECPQS